MSRESCRDPIVVVVVPRVTPSYYAVRRLEKGRYKPLQASSVTIRISLSSMTASRLPQTSSVFALSRPLMLCLAAARAMASSGRTVIGPNTVDKTCHLPLYLEPSPPLYSRHAQRACPALPPVLTPPTTPWLGADYPSPTCHSSCCSPQVRMLRGLGSEGADVLSPTHAPSCPTQ